MDGSANSCCGGGGCGDLSRRQFLKTAGAGIVALSVVDARAAAAPAGTAPKAGGLLRAGGLPDAAGSVARNASHFVPLEKRLDASWIASLFERGAPRELRDRQLNLVGMPIGGIAAGQVYLCGDGSIGCWQIFNQRYFSGYGATNFQPRMPERPVQQGFAVAVQAAGEPGAAAGDAADTAVVVRHLNRLSFPETSFVGEYPIGRVTWAAADFPVRVELEAFSPFIPLKVGDSALPATMLHLTVRNESRGRVRTALGGWLQNAVCHHSGPQFDLRASRWTRRFSMERPVGDRSPMPDRPVGDRSPMPNRPVGDWSPMPNRPVGDRSPKDERSMPASVAIALHGVAAETIDEAARPDLVLADFEGGTWGEWAAVGSAPGSQPASGTLKNQGRVTGFLGQGLVNTFVGGDDTTGKVTSPAFEIQRHYINFLIGGGKQPGEACINLLVDGKVVRSATGRNEERLIWAFWDVRELEGQSAQIEIVDQKAGGWGHINVDQIEMSDRAKVGPTGRIEDLEDFGTMALALDAAAADADRADEPVLAALRAWLPAGCEAAATIERPLHETYCAALLTPAVELASGESRTFLFVLAWHMPNREHGQMYSNWFGDAGEVAAYVLAERERLAAQTRLWHETFYSGSLPRWLLDRLHSTVGNLATGTCQWWVDGRFWAWEGVGCCAGTCTHVWNYAHGMARLFPELERSVRSMQDLGAALHDNGLVGFRGEKNNWYAADGQAGTVLKCYREHLMSADDRFLEAHWPKIRSVLEYLLNQDGDRDGLIDASQHNTYDIDFHGPNTFVGSLYLAALRAGEEMARESGENEFAEVLRRVFEAGSRRTVECLWNGEYFVQEVDLERYPRDQYGDGCLSDQLFGQGWAHQLALGYLYPPEYVRRALESVWRYNWSPDIGPHNAVHKPERWFANPGQAGLFTCTWPKGPYLAEGVRYREEVWTGIEYQVAGHMIWEGMIEPAMAMVRAVHERYDPMVMNPYNEVECGDHYARALASWGVYTALCGFEYHGPRGHIGFAPRLSAEDFRAAFTAAEGWGTFSQRRGRGRQQAKIELAWGELRLSSITLETAADAAGGAVRVVQEGEAVGADAAWDGTRVRIVLHGEARLAAGQRLEVSIG